MKFYNQPIPKGKLNQFHEILKSCGGRYLSNPRYAPDEYGEVRVSYSYENIRSYKKHDGKWKMATLDFTEKIKKPWWARLFLR